MKTAMPIRIAVCGAWLLTVVLSMVVMANYQSADGKVGQTPGHWPPGTQIALDKDRATLLMFAHPQCPCTRASVEELNRLLAQCSGKVSTHVFFLKPAAISNEWSQTSLRRSIAAIPGVSIHDDFDSKEARRFGAETSGYVVLYDSAGNLLFKGGITESRGQAGDNAGKSAIVSLLAGKEMDLGQTPVFGCPLKEPDAN